MNLFPVPNVSAGNRNEPDLSEQINVMTTPQQVQNKEEEIENAQLTMFYDGKVIVFDKFPAKKAQELMEMASKCALTNSGFAPLLQPEPSAPVDLAMPIARRGSLHRFLEKRKERINSQTPYVVQSSSELEKRPAKFEKNLTWLELGHIKSFSLDFKR